MIRAKPALEEVVEDPGLLPALDLEPLALLLEEAKGSAVDALNAARAVQEEVLSRYADEIERAFGKAGLEVGSLSLPTRCGRYRLVVDRYRRADGTVGSAVRPRRGG